MASTPVHAALTQVELDLVQVAVALESGEPVALEQASSTLRQGAVALSILVQRLTTEQRQDKELALRLKQIAASMATQREGLIRRSVLVTRALHVVVPATQETTYTQANSPYGRPAKQTGAFKYLSA